MSLAFADAVDGITIGPFIYGIKERRGKRSITFSSRFVSELTLATKLDFFAASWLEPMRKGWIAMPIHSQYGVPLP